MFKRRSIYENRVHAKLNPVGICEGSEHVALIGHGPEGWVQSHGEYQGCGPALAPILHEVIVGKFITVTNPMLTMLGMPCVRCHAYLHGTSLCDLQRRKIR